MNYLAVKDLKKTRELWSNLEIEKELIITRDGKPSAILVSITPEIVEESLIEIRKALFSISLSRTRKKGSLKPITDKEIESITSESRKSRGLK
jgi:antitoxin (DNA-binding transcriptional repressor) of toxin-antitoxin stability system